MAKNPRQIVFPGILGSSLIAFFFMAMSIIVFVTSEHSFSALWSSPFFMFVAISIGYLVRIILLIIKKQEKLENGKS